MCNEKLAEHLAKKLQNLQVYTPIPTSTSDIKGISLDLLQIGISNNF